MLNSRGVNDGMVSSDDDTDLSVETNDNIERNKTRCVVNKHTHEDLFEYKSLVIRGGNDDMFSSDDNTDLSVDNEL